MNPTTTTYPRKNGARTAGVAPTLEPDSTAGHYELQAKMDAVNRAQAVIEYNMDGTVITANENFLNIFGYRLEEIQGQHTSMFADAADRDSEELRQLWCDLEAGKARFAESKRIGKHGKQVWLEASYNPICDRSGKPHKVIVFAIDATATKLQSADFQGQIAAISKTQCLLEFNLDGKFLAANENFLKAFGFRLEDVVGKNHREFVDPAVASSAAYKQVWSDLNCGKSYSEEAKRVLKDGKEVWVEESFYPILDFSGKPFKVIAVAVDITTRKTLENNLKKTFASVAQNAAALSSASEELAANSQQMVSNAEETAAQAGVVSAAAEQVSKNVQTVATGTEEMSASIKEIAKNAQDAVKVAAVAVKVAETTNATVVKLGESSAEIGKVIKVITSIAQQTNLLALNATIEAARAGEAGKGFAVVANEVKELAKETAKATEDIGQKIEAIQTATKSAVQAIGEISGTINKINDYQNTIASAVEEQTVTTNEIARNVAEAAKGSSEIAQNIAGVATAARSTTSGANDTKKASVELSRMAAELQAIVTASDK